MQRLRNNKSKKGNNKTLVCQNKTKTHERFSLGDLEVITKLEKEII